MNSPVSLGEETLFLVQCEFGLHRTTGAVHDFNRDFDILTCKMNKAQTVSFQRVELF